MTGAPSRMAMATRAPFHSAMSTGGPSHLDDFLMATSAGLPMGTTSALPFSTTVVSSQLLYLIPVPFTTTCPVDTSKEITARGFVTIVSTLLHLTQASGQKEPRCIFFTH